MKFPKNVEIKEILGLLKDKYEVILFGSAVEGGVRHESDVNIAIITETKVKIRI